MEEMDQVWSEHKALLNEVEAEIRRGLQSKVELVNEVTQYLLDSGGKRIRPLLLIISAYLCDYLDKGRLFLGGSIVEYIHTATLLHDDVIDNAEIRRGIAPARVLWGNQASILVGDYLYTLALSLTVKVNNFEINTLLADTCLRMAEGEMLQLTHQNDLQLTEETYFKIIEHKTSALISASCQVGAILAKAPRSKKMRPHPIREKPGDSLPGGGRYLRLCCGQSSPWKSPWRRPQRGKNNASLASSARQMHRKGKDLVGRIDGWEGFPPRRFKKGHRLDDDLRLGPLCLKKSTRFRRDRQANATGLRTLSLPEIPCGGCRLRRPKRPLDTPYRRCIIHALP